MNARVFLVLSLFATFACFTLAGSLATITKIQYADDDTTCSGASTVVPFHTSSECNINADGVTYTAWMCSGFSTGQVATIYQAVYSNASCQAYGQDTNLYTVSEYYGGCQQDTFGYVTYNCSAADGGSSGAYVFPPSENTFYQATTYFSAEGVQSDNCKLGATGFTQKSAVSTTYCYPNGGFYWRFGCDGTFVGQGNFGKDATCMTPVYAMLSMGDGSCSNGVEVTKCASGNSNIDLSTIPQATIEYNTTNSMCAGSFDDALVYANKECVQALTSYSFSTTCLQNTSGDNNWYMTLSQYNTATHTGCSGNADNVYTLVANPWRLGETPSSCGVKEGLDSDNYLAFTCSFEAGSSSTIGVSLVTLLAAIMVALVAKF